MEIYGDEKYKIREQKIEGCIDDKWWWQAQDNGAWDGPVKDWNNSHYTKYFTHCTERKTVITAGGNHGLHVRPYAAIFELVYAFEPDLDNFAALVRNCQYDNVFFFRAGLGEIPGWGEIKFGDRQNVGTHKIEHRGTEGHLPIMQIDQMNIQNVSMIQLDVESYEPYVIRGAKDTIARWKPVIVTEGDHPGVREVIEPLGYKRIDNSIADVIYVTE